MTAGLRLLRRLRLLARTTISVIASAAKQSRGPQALLILLCLAAPGAHAQDFYKGRTINLYIGFGVGGSYDLYGRLVAQHLGRHIPGGPTIVPLQMPGAGGLAAANYMAKVAAKDGTAIAITSQTVVIDQLTGETGVAYDARDFSWLGRVTTSATLFFTWHSSPTKTFVDAQQRETTMGSSGSGDTTDPPRALNALAGAKFKLVLGYRGSNEVQLAIERGEIEGGYALWSDFKFRKADWLRDRQVNLLFFVADKRDPDFRRAPVDRADADRRRQGDHGPSPRRAWSAARSSPPPAFPRRASSCCAGPSPRCSPTRISSPTPRASGSRSIR